MGECVAMTYLSELSLSELLDGGEAVWRELLQLQRLLPQKLHVARHRVVTRAREALDVDTLEAGVCGREAERLGRHFRCESAPGDVRNGVIA